MSDETRLLLAFDGAAWFIRRVRVIEHDLDLDEKVYRCDLPLGGPYATLEGAVAALKQTSGAKTEGRGSEPDPARAVHAAADPLADRSPASAPFGGLPCACCGGVRDFSLNGYPQAICYACNIDREKQVHDEAVHGCVLHLMAEATALAQGGSVTHGSVTGRLDTARAYRRAADLLSCRVQPKESRS